MCVGKARSLTYSLAPEKMFDSGRLRPFPNIRLGPKDFLGTHPLAHYENLQIMAVKSFITLVPGVNVIKLFTAVIYGFY
jgi:hypothetical protein